MFIAEEEHSMWCNDIRNIRVGKQTLSIHEHKTAITIIPLTGEVFNVGFTEDQTHPQVFAVYEYHSAIVSGGEGKFVFSDQLVQKYLQESLISKPLYIPVNEPHTIYVPYGKAASWLIIEGEDNTGTTMAKCYSTDAHLDMWAPSELYKVATEAERENLLNKFLRNKRV